MLHLGLNGALMATVCDVTLLSGREVRLMELRQSWTYEGMLEGLPTGRMNQRHLDSLLTERQGKPYPQGPVHMIVPTERPIQYCADTPYPFGTPAELPRVTCIGRFKSWAVAREEYCYYSGLVVIWFQDEFAFPIDPAVMEKLRAIDWERLAVDVEI